MIGWLWRIIVGRFTSCTHEWEILERIDVFEGGYTRPVAVRYVLQCENCGTIRKKEIGQ